MLAALPILYLLRKPRLCCSLMSLDEILIKNPFGYSQERREAISSSVKVEEVSAARFRAKISFGISSFRFLIRLMPLVVL